MFDETYFWLRKCRFTVFSLRSGAYGYWEELCFERFEPFLCFGSRWELCDPDGVVVKILVADSEGGG